MLERAIGSEIHKATCNSLSTRFCDHQAPDIEEVIMRVQKLCYTGAHEPTKNEIGGVSSDLHAIPKSDYKSTNGGHKQQKKTRQSETNVHQIAL